ncbi:hypothetical protein PG991_003454 [Apiospora marii]|uniref:Uncharacterized protein n=1 Tax=Apiospora marii TaxID=335849 RepID=A0ABR1S4W6_9PEZI
MVWKEFAKAEAASRIVPLHATSGIIPKNVDEDKTVDNDCPWLVLGLMPLRRLVSPLLRVCAGSREVALAHYRTRVDIYETPPLETQDVLEFVPPWEQWLERKEEIDEMGYWPRDGRARLGSSRPNCSFHPFAPYREHAWADRAEYALEVESEFVSCATGVRIWDQRLPDGEEGTDAQVAAAHDLKHRGCVYLDLASDRFLPLCAERIGGIAYEDDPTYGWLSAIGDAQDAVCGLRELSTALSDFKYDGVPLNHEKLEGILERLPPVLRYTSLHLSDKIRAGIRHIVFPSYSAPPRPSSRHPWRHTERARDALDEAAAITALNPPGRPLDIQPRRNAHIYPLGLLDTGVSQCSRRNRPPESEFEFYLILAILSDGDGDVDVHLGLPGQHRDVPHLLRRPRGQGPGAPAHPEGGQEMPRQRRPEELGPGLGQ